MGVGLVKGVEMMGDVIEEMEVRLGVDMADTGLGTGEQVWYTFLHYH